MNDEIVKYAKLDIAIVTSLVATADGLAAAIRERLFALDIDRRSEAAHRPDTVEVLINVCEDLLKVERQLIPAEKRKRTEKGS